MTNTTKKTPITVEQVATLAPPPDSVTALKDISPEGLHQIMLGLIHDYEHGDLPEAVANAFIEISETLWWETDACIDLYNSNSAARQTFERNQAIWAAKISVSNGTPEEWATNQDEIEAAGERAAVEFDMAVTKSAAANDNTSTNKKEKAS